METFDTLEFNDGRVVELFSKPQRIDGEIVGPGLELPRRHRPHAASRTSSPTGPSTTR